jgi:hypothetical protein
MKLTLPIVGVFLCHLWDRFVERHTTEMGFDGSFKDSDMRLGFHWLHSVGKLDDRDCDVRIFVVKIPVWRYGRITTLVNFDIGERWGWEQCWLMHCVGSPSSDGWSAHWFAKP